MTFDGKVLLNKTLSGKSSLRDQASFSPGWNLGPHFARLHGEFQPRRNV